MQSWTLWSLDVWGNDEDGYEVNDRSCIVRDFFLPDDATDSKIILHLQNLEYLNPKQRRSKYAVSGDDGLIFIDWKANGKPLLQLERND